MIYFVRNLLGLIVVVVSLWMFILMCLKLDWRNKVLIFGGLIGSRECVFGFLVLIFFGYLIIIIILLVEEMLK